MLVDLFTTKEANLLDMAAVDARHVLAARSWFILRTTAVDPVPRMKGYLGSYRIAVRFALLMETVSQIWPEPFVIHRPCCANASIDEGVLASAICFAAAGNGRAFEMLLKEMLSGEARAQLFERARALYA